MSRSADPDFRAKAEATRYGAAAGLFRIAPPLTVDAAEIDLGLEGFGRALTKALH